MHACIGFVHALSSQKYIMLNAKVAFVMQRNFSIQQHMNNMTVLLLFLYLAAKQKGLSLATEE